MEYEESYQGRRLIVTTREDSPGNWTSTAELVDGDQRTLFGSPGSTYPSEDHARRAALSLAAAAVDRARSNRGKP